MNTSTRILCLAIALGSATAACADPAVHTQTVQWLDLNLESQAGIQSLQGRLEQAARQVCAPSMERQLVSVAPARHCREQALAAAVARVHSPALSALIAAKAPQPMVLARR
jgi:UrcA family protein